VCAVIKQREILFCTLHPDPNQAGSAALLLTDMEGIRDPRPIEPHRLHLSYDLTVITYQEIESGLAEVGFHLDNSLMTKLKRALIHYTEETARANLGCPKGKTNCTDGVFVSRYQRLQHGCRDQRPDHWRNYL